MTQALRDRHVQMVLLTVLAVSGIAWWLLLALPPAVQIFICGSGGYGPAGGAWNAERLIALAGMWLVMAPAMMLPAAAVAMMRRSGTSPLSFAAGYLGLVGAVSVAAACGQWVLESAGLIGDGSRILSPLLSGAVLSGIGAFHVWQFLRDDRASCGSAGGRGVHEALHRRGLLLGWRHGCASLACCLTMIGLQLVAGAMNIGLMIGLTLWMLLEAVVPWKRQLSGSTGIALVVAGGLTMAGAMG